MIKTSAKIIMNAFLTSWTIVLLSKIALLVELPMPASEWNLLLFLVLLLAFCIKNMVQYLLKEYSEHL